MCVCVCLPCERIACFPCVSARIANERRRAWFGRMAVSDTRARRAAPGRYTKAAPTPPARALARDDQKVRGPQTFQQYIELWKSHTTTTDTKKEECKEAMEMAIINGCKPFMQELYGETTIKFMSVAAITKAQGMSAEQMTDNLKKTKPAKHTKLGKRWMVWVNVAPSFPKRHSALGSVAQCLRHPDQRVCVCVRPILSC